MELCGYEDFVSFVEIRLETRQIIQDMAEIVSFMDFVGVRAIT